MGDGRTSDVIDEYRHTHGLLPKHLQIFKSACLPDSSVRHEELKTDFLLVLSSISAPYLLTLLLMGGSVAKWLACRTQARKSTGSNRSRGAVE